MVNYVVISKQKRKPVIVSYHASNIHERKYQRHIQIRIFEKGNRKKHTHSLEGTFQRMAYVCVGKDRLFLAVVLGVIRPKVLGV
jgi:hypothetical protein